MKNKSIIIVSGQPKSIFFEILFKCLKNEKFKSPIILICCKNIFFRQMKIFNYKKNINLINIDQINKLKIDNKLINLIDLKLKSSSNSNEQFNFTKQYIKNSFKIAIKLIKKKNFYKLINGPINKKKYLNKNFFGVTELISSYFKKKQTSMLIYNNKLSVCPLTTHLPIKLVSKKITKKLIQEKLKTINNFFLTNFKFKPRIGVTGLNPHCESLLKYNEDEKIISPAIKLSKKNGIAVHGPYPADTIFLKQNRKKFDVILGMYHDQVLTPLKTLYEYDAINITMGLPFLRVSPDHGPNEKMVNKNLSNPTSLYKALKFLDKN